MSTHSQTGSGKSHAQIPDFVVGQDHSGHWLAIETHGLAGGLFASREAALHYAMEEAHRRPEAIHIAGEPIEFRV